VILLEIAWGTTGSVCRFRGDRVNRQGRAGLQPGRIQADVCIANCNFKKIGSHHLGTNEACNSLPSYAGVHFFENVKIAFGRNCCQEPFLLKARIVYDLKLGTSLRKIL
jgi:hypothetical protein